MSDMDIKIGDYCLVGSHKGCKYNGNLMRCTPQTINGEIYPKAAAGVEPTTEWFWCNGKKWSRLREDDAGYNDQSSKQWSYCGYSTRFNNDKIR